MKFLNILAKKIYTDESGAEKATWFKVGHIKITPSGAHYLVWYCQPETIFQVFESTESAKE